MDKAKWIQGCVLCNSGIVIAIKERLANGMSERAACKELAEISAREYPELADEFSMSRIRRRWFYHGKGKTGNEEPVQNVPPKSRPETPIDEMDEAWLENDRWNEAHPHEPKGPKHKKAFDADEWEKEKAEWKKEEAEFQKEYEEARKSDEAMWKEISEKCQFVDDLDSFKADPHYIETAVAVIGLGYRELSKKMHPDHTGGSHEDMVRLNSVKQWMLQLMAVMAKR